MMISQTVRVCQLPMDLAINVDLIIAINQTANGLYLFSRLVFYIKLYTIEGIHNVVGFVSKLESFCLMILSINPKKEIYH